MSDPDFTHAVFLSRSPKDKAVVRVSSLSASNGKKQVGRLIHLIRGEKVLLDADLAVLSGVTTGAPNRAVKRDPDRFPPDFMFQLTADEAVGLRFQFGTLKRGQHFKYLPQAFTQEGVAMLSSVLRSPRAVQVNIAIMPAFSLSASDGERMGCQNGHFAVRPVAASRQSAAFSAGWQTREQKDGGALSSRRYAAKIGAGLEDAQSTFQPSAFILRPLLRVSPAQFLYFNWLPEDREQEHPKPPGRQRSHNRNRLGRKVAGGPVWAGFSVVGVLTQR
ncbi:MAG: ORF6N domain-containing protein [Verrucomicrobiota bacterium]|jgi:hypothetical protein